MSYNNVNPFQELLSGYVSPLLGQTINGSLYDAFNTNGRRRGQLRLRGNTIPVRMTRSTRNVIIYAEMPGFDKNSINIDFNENELLISGTKKAPEVEDDEKVTDLSTIKYGDFKSTITLPIPVVEEEKVVVKYENGLLKITINKDVSNNFSVRLNE